MTTARVSWRAWVLVVGVALLMTSSGHAQTLPPPVPPLPPPDPAALPLQPPAVEVEPPPPAPPRDSAESTPRTAAEAFSSLGGFGAGPGGGIGALLSPTLGNMPYRASLGFSWYPSEPVSSQPTSLAEYREDFAASAPIWQNDRNEWSLSANVRAEEFHTSAILPTTEQPFPNQLIDVRFGTSYRHEFDNDWIAGVGGTFGSASNEPFHSISELTAGVNAFLRVPQGDHNAWLFTVNYSTNSQINVPIPGVAYLWVPSNYFQAVIGFPFASANYRPTDDLTLSLSYALLTTIHARATYRLAPSWRIYAAYDWDNESYFRVPREDDRDRFFYYEQRVSSGVQYTLTSRTNLDFSGGFAFDRYYFEGQSLSDSHNNRIDVAPGPYLALRILFHY